MSDFIEVGNKYLEDNGETATPNAGLLGALNDFQTIWIGAAPASNQAQTGYETYELAKAAATGPPNYYAGRGLWAERRREIFIGPDELNPSVYCYDIKAPPNTPTTPNFWGNSTYTDFTKAGFLAALQSIITNLTTYKLVLTNISEAFVHIRKSDGQTGKNDKFPDFVKDASFFDDNNLTPLITNITTSITNLNSSYSYFNTASGSASDFNTRLTSLGTYINTCRGHINTRNTSNYYTQAMGWLRKWRTFWIKERIFKHSGSLVAYLGMIKARTMANDELAAKEATLNVLFNNKDEWIKDPEIIATYFNPIIKETQAGEEYTYTETKRISLLVTGQDHTAHHKVYRKTLAGAASFGFNNNNDWEEASFVGNATEDIYDDTYNLTGGDTIFVYRIRAVDNINSPNTMSNQSKVLGQEVSILQVPSNKKIVVGEEISGFIYINNTVNYIVNSVAVENGFELELRDTITGTPNKLNRLTCVASNYYMN